MREVIALSVGFLLARQLYINQEKKEARRKEQGVKNRLHQFLKDKGLTPEEVKKQLNELMG